MVKRSPRRAQIKLLSFGSQKKPSLEPSTVTALRFGLLLSRRKARLKILTLSSSHREVKTTRSLYGKLTVLCERRLKGHSTGILGLRFSSDGQILASASSDQTVKLWRLDGTELTTLKGHSATVWSVAFSPDNQLIASGSDDKTIKLWKPDDTGWHKAQLLRTLKGHGARVYKVTFSPNGQIIASASADRTVKLWKLDGTLLKTLAGHDAAVWGVAFSHQGNTIASASVDGTIKLWDSDGNLLRTINSEGDTFTRVAFSPDGQMIVTGGHDNAVKLWKLDGTMLTTLTRHSSIVWDVDFSPDSKTIASASEDQTVILWDLQRILKLDELAYGCSWVQDYLRTNADVASGDRTLCKGVGENPVKAQSPQGTLHSVADLLPATHMGLSNRLGQFNFPKLPLHSPFWIKWHRSSTTSFALESFGIIALTVRMRFGMD